MTVETDEEDFNELVLIVDIICEAMRRNPNACCVAIEGVAERVRVLRQKRKIVMPIWAW